MQRTLGEIAAYIDAPLSAATDTPIHAIASLQQAEYGDISFCTATKYRSLLRQTRASAVLVTAELATEVPSIAIVVANPYVAYAKISALFAPVNKPATISDRAVIATDATIGNNVAIEPFVVIESGVVVGDNTRISAGSHIGANVTIGSNCTIYPNVTIYHDCCIGSEVTIHAGTVIGADGFGFANEQGQWRKIYQLGRVIIGNRVEIGANTTIDRGALDDTVIADGVIIDNLVQIAHNVTIGTGSAVAGCVGIAGSAHIGDYCAIGGGAGILGHLEIANGVTVTATSLVTKSIPNAGVYSSGTPLQPKKEWQRNFARFKQLDEMAKRISTLEQQLEKLNR